MHGDDATPHQPRSAGRAGGAAAAPWGPWWTVGIAAGVLALYALLQLVVMAGFLAVAGDSGGLAAVVDARFGTIFWVWMALAAPAATAAVALAAAARRPGRVAVDLGLVRPPRRAALAWLAATLAVTAAYDALSSWLDRPVIPDFMVRAYDTAGFLPGLVLAVVLLAPVFEEILFRGFVFPGLARSRLGPLGAIVATAAAWAAIHLQYDPFDLAAIFVLGLVFGVARWRTGSTALTISLHAAVNGAAMIQVVLLLG